MDTPPDPSPAASPSSQQDQFRLRKQRREAKIKAGGASRLDRITSLTGRKPDPESSSPLQPSSTPTGSALSTPTPLAASSDDAAGDPAEVDISQHYYAPSRSPASDIPMSEDRLKQMMLQLDSTFGSNQTPRDPALGGFPGVADAPEGSHFPDSNSNDPMTQMLQQMMGNAGGEGGLPPGFASMFGGQLPDQPQPSELGYIWRILHALFALSLGIYSVVVTSFDGSHISRTQTTDGTDSFRIFWVFATVEVLLQTSRFFLEKGRLAQGGLLGMVGGLLPEPYSGYVRIISRYSIIYTTVVADAMVVLFILGAVAWWKGRIS